MDVLYQNRHVAKPSLIKSEVMSIIVEHLKENPRTQTTTIRREVTQRLYDENIIGTITVRQGMMSETFERRISDEDALLINECIYDLLYARIITPGANAGNLELPSLHVSDKEKLEEYK